MLIIMKLLEINIWAYLYIFVDDNHKFSPTF